MASSIGIHPKRFDEGRLVDMARYNELKTLRDKSAFMFMEDDYMTYLRSQPWRWDDSWVGDQQQELALRFINAIQGDVAWGLARQMILEFQAPRPDFETLDEPIKTILLSVADRLAPPPPEPFDGQAFEEAHHFDRSIDQLKYIAFVGAATVADTGDRQREVELAVARLKALTSIGALAHDTTPSQGVKEEDVSVAASADLKPVNVVKNTSSDTGEREPSKRSAGESSRRPGDSAQHIPSRKVRPGGGRKKPAK